MSAKRHNHKIPGISAADFPALRDFLRGYFHQDLEDEYGSPEAAARQFCQDADAEQRRAVAEEWERFLEQMKGQPLAATNDILTSTLSSAYGFENLDEIKKVSAVFREHCQQER